MYLFLYDRDLRYERVEIIICSDGYVSTGYVST